MVIYWWLIWWMVGLAGWAWTVKIFCSWEDRGYVFGKIGGVLLITFAVYVLGFVKILPFSFWGIVGCAAGIYGAARIKKEKLKGKTNWKLILTEELLFGAALLLWSYIKGHEATINGLEKFMDYGFTKSILTGKYFPPADMWFAGKTINYYYFGHLYLAVMTKLSGIDLAYTFNLILATLFALALTMSFGIGYRLLGGFGRITRILGALLIAYLLSLSGNLHTIYAFTKGYTGDNPPPFWTIWSDISQKEEFKTGWDTYWYPNATRFIPYTIHEFPSYSFVVSDIHGHVLSIPIALLLMAMLVNIFGQKERKSQWSDWIFYGFTAGTAFMTNALDGPIYLGLFAVLQIVLNLQFTIHNSQTFVSRANSKFQITNFKTLVIPVLVAGAVFVITALPFLMTFKPFVNGVAVNCPPAFLAERKIGPLLFETTDKCQKSPLWMMLVLWGFFIYAGIWLFFTRSSKENGTTEKMLLLWSAVALGLIIFPEFFYFKDIYPLHFRSNTMFKLGYQAFMLMSIAAGYVIVRGIANLKKNKWWLLGILPLLYLVSIYPTFSIKSYFGKITAEGYKGLYGLRWLEERYPDNNAAMIWLANNVPQNTQPVILEAGGDSYTDADMFSTFTGLPTVAGWTVHEWLWRGGYDSIAARTEEVRRVYEEGSMEESQSFLTKYQVRFIIVGTLERQKYPQLNEVKIKALGVPVFTSGETVIYRVN